MIDEALVIAVARNLFVAVKALAAKLAPELVAESEAHLEAVRCLMNVLMDRPVWAEPLLTASSCDAHPIQAEIVSTFELVACDSRQRDAELPSYRVPQRISDDLPEDAVYAPEADTSH
jgi:hypothetical protein